jgi:hypothetical protein
LFIGKASWLDPRISNNISHREVFMAVLEFVVIHVPGTCVDTSYSIETQLPTSAGGAHGYLSQNSAVCAFLAELFLVADPRLAVGG